MANNTEATNNNILYSLDSSDATLKYGAPRLIPNNKSGINVTADFPWTTLPARTRVNVPCIELREYRLTSSTLIQSFIQQARSAVDAVGGAAGNAGESLIGSIKNGLKMLDFNVSDDEMNKWLDSIPSVKDVAFLDPYKHLYPVTSTGWYYIFPFLTGQNQKGSNSWGTGGKDDISQAVIQTKKKGVSEGKVGKVINMAEVAGQTSKIFNILEPGSYTENIKHYKPSGDESYKVQFTLSNTGEFNDVQRNWELCFILTYQNRPNRRSVSLLDPPVIYNTTIPGVNQLLYSYISELQIDNLGTSRYINLPIGRKLIPEAYNISFTINSLLTPTQNLLLYAHTGSKIEVDVS